MKLLSPGEQAETMEPRHKHQGPFRVTPVIPLGNMADGDALIAGDEVVADDYLDHLKRILTNTIERDEPALDQPHQQAFVQQFIEHYINGPALSMLPLARFDHLRTCIEDVISRRVPGDLIETGTWRGGASIFMRAVLREHGVTDRVVWLADSFEGLPEPDPEKFPIEARMHKSPVMERRFNRFAASLEEVQRNFASFGLLDDQVRFLEGWFKDTLPVAPISALAVLRLDGDYYESTMDALTSLYAKVSPGGYTIVDDYGEDSWTYCRQAVDDFRRANGITEPMTRVDSKCYYWRRAD
jgi:hypothetical protein